MQLRKKAIEDAINGNQDKVKPYLELMNNHMELGAKNINESCDLMDKIGELIKANRPIENRNELKF